MRDNRHNTDDAVDPSWRSHPFYRYQFSIQIFLSVLGISLNSFCLRFFLNTDQKYRSVYHVLNVVVTSVDLTFVAVTCVENIIHISRGRYLSLDYPSLCYFDAIIAYICTIWSISLIACIAHVIKLQLCHQIMTTSRESMLLAVVSGLYASISCTITIFYAAGGAEVTRSGNYCVARLSTYGNVSLVIIGYGPLVWLGYSFYKIYIAIRDSQRMLKNAGLKGQAKLRYFQRVKRLGLFLSSIGLCETPLICAIAYESFTKNKLHGWLLCLVGMLSLMYSSLMNPMIFILSNPRLRESMAEAFDKLSRWKKKGSREVVIINHQEQEKIMALGYIQSWLTVGTVYHDLLREYCKSIHATENIDFLEDVQNYRNKGYEFLQLYHDNSMHIDKIKEKWRDLNSSANRIYGLYMQIPSAPLEINIDAQTRENMIKALNAVARSVRDKDVDALPSSEEPNQSGRSQRYISHIHEEHSDVKFCDLWRSRLDQRDGIVMTYIGLFDEAATVIKENVDIDIWPRFKKSIYYREGIKLSRRNCAV